MKKQIALLLAALTIVLSGAAGFGGAFLAGSFANTSVVSQEDATVYDLNDVPERDGEDKDADFNSLIASPDDDPSAAMSLLNNQGDTPEPQTAKPQTLTIPQIAELASSSVVEIYTESVVNSGRMGQFVTEGAGSGVIITSDGYIVTNNHVIEGSARITVVLSNGDEYTAALIGRDSKTDLAVLKIDASRLKAAILGNSDKILVGELAVAIGNPLGKLGGSVSEGIISALSRSIEIDGHMMTLLQTTAAVNPGNSGGGLFNGYGELIGIVNAKSSGTDIEGIGFAIPVNLVKAITDSLINHGYVLGRIDFGATLVDVLDSWTAMMYRVHTTGVYVSRADSDSPLQAGDRIISINGKQISNSADVYELLDTRKVGETLTIVVSRNGNEVTVPLTLRQEVL